MYKNQIFNECKTMIEREIAAPPKQYARGAKIYEENLSADDNLSTEDITAEKEYKDHLRSKVITKVNEYSDKLKETDLDTIKQPCLLYAGLD